MKAYNRQDVRVKMTNTPILSGPDCSSRKSFSKSSPYTPHPDSSINGSAGLGMPAGVVPLPPPPMPQCSGTSMQHPSPGLSLHNRQHIQQQQQQQLHLAQSALAMVMFIFVVVVQS